MLYVPLPGEGNASAFTAYAPSLYTLLDINGAVATAAIAANKTGGRDSTDDGVNANASTVANITVRDLSLVHAAADLSGFFIGDCDAQSGTNLQTAAVQLSNSRNITLANMQVANGGGFGLWPRYNCEDITMARIRVNDIGSGAVRVGDQAGGGSGGGGGDVIGRGTRSQRDDSGGSNVGGGGGGGGGAATAEVPSYAVRFVLTDSILEDGGQCV